MIPEPTSNDETEGLNINTNTPSTALPLSMNNEQPPTSLPRSVTSSHEHAPQSLFTKFTLLLQVPHTLSPRTVSSSSTIKHKFSALEASQSAQSSSSGKKLCAGISGAVALNGIKESLDKFNITIECSLVPPPDCVHAHTSPEHHAKAMSCLQELETHLDDGAH
jgi:hypothetical protein